MEERGADGDAAFGQAVARLVHRDAEHACDQCLVERLRRATYARSESSCPRPPIVPTRPRWGARQVELPLVPLNDDLTIALLICVDMGVAFAETAGRELADLMRPSEPEIVVSVATMGIPLAIEASRALGLDDYVILHKTPKIHLGESWSEPVHSITTDKPQRLRMDPARVDAVRGGGSRWSTTSSPPARRWRPPCGLVRRMDAEPVVVGHAHDRRRRLAAAPSARTQRSSAALAPCRCSTPTAPAAWSRTGTEAPSALDCQPAYVVSNPSSCSSSSCFTFCSASALWRQEVVDDAADCDPHEDAEVGALVVVA